jgi:hypothetical protein
VLDGVQHCFRCRDRRVRRGIHDHILQRGHGISFDSFD